MFGTLGGQEIIFILVLALIVFGPRKLPEIGKSIGRMMAEFRKASNDFRRTLEEEVEAEKVRPAETPAPVDPSATVGPPSSPSADAAATPAYSPDAESAAPAPSAPEPSGVDAPAEPTVSRPAPTGVGRPDGRFEPH